jgi:hypothetical protein
MKPTTPTTEQVKAASVASLVAFLCANPAADLCVYCGDVIAADGRRVATFANHASAIIAVRITREEIAKRLS